jgi:hypothetical protein
MAVEAEIQSEVQDYELNDDDYLEVANRCWLRFYSCCVQYHQAGARPVGLVLLDQSGVVLVKKQQISLLRFVMCQWHVFGKPPVWSYPLCLTAVQLSIVPV